MTETRQHVVVVAGGLPDIVSASLSVRLSRTAFIPAVMLAVMSLPGVFSTVSGGEQHSVTVSIDPRIELLAVVQLLGGYGDRYGLINKYDSPYRRGVESHFAPYKEHPAVRMFAQMSASGFSFDAPAAAMLHLSDPPDLGVAVPFTDYLARRAGGKERLEELVERLRSFAHDTDFMAFFAAHNETFHEAVANVHKKIQGVDCVGGLQDYYGMQQHSYNLILVPLFRGSYGSRIPRSDGAHDIYCVSEAMGVENGFAVFGSAERLNNIMWHEFGHSFVNPLTAKHRGHIARSSALYRPIAEQMKQQAYSSWENCVNEHIVRAVHIRLAGREIGKEAAARLRRHDRMRGFFYVDALCERLKEYENQRNKYPTMEAFYPRLVDVFRGLSEKDLGDQFYSAPLGNINSVVSDRESMVFVVPTNERDEAVEQRIRAFAEAIRDKFFDNRPVITDEQALQRDLSSNSLIVYGTPTGNLWLAQHIGDIPVRIERDRIVADTVYVGSNLRFITIWPNPQNPEKGVVIYTAQRPEAVIDINSVFHGPTDYVVAKEREILRASYYKKHNGQWSFE